MSGPWIRRSAGLLYLAAVLIMLLRLGPPDYFSDWLALAPFVAWVVSPVLGGQFISSKFKGDAARLLCGLSVAVIAVVGFMAQWHAQFIAPPDAQSAIALFVGPLYQWGGVLGMALGWLVWRAIQEVQ